jgi:hypothetical protein
MKTQAIITSLLIFLAGTCAAQTYKKGTAADLSRGEPYYILPKATIQFEIPILTEKYDKGAYFVQLDTHQLKYAALKYGLDRNTYLKVQKDKSYTQHSIRKDSIKIQLQARPDYDKIYFADTKKNWNNNKSLSFSYGPDGILTEGEATTENKTFDLITKGIGSIASLATIGFKQVSPDNSKKDDFQIEALEKILAQIAELGGVAETGIYTALKADLEKQYTKAFAQYFYAEKKSVRTIRFFYTPSGNAPTGASEKLFAFDQQNGKLTFSDDPNIKNAIRGKEIHWGNITNLAGYTLRLSRAQDNLLPATTTTTPFPDGFAYNIPLHTNVEFSAADNTIISSDILKIPQYGTVAALNTKNRKTSYILDPISGELKKISIGSSALSTDQLGSASTSAQDILKLIKSDSEVTKLEKEVKRLENEKKRRELLKALESL